VSAPTTGDAIRRRLASFPNRHGGRSIGRLIYVGKGRAKLALPSGAHVTVRREDVQVLVEAPRALP
jgi:hypothetical protein